MKKKTRRDKRQYVNGLACEAQLAAGLLTLETQRLDRWRITNQDNIAITIQRRKWNWIPLGRTEIISQYRPWTTVHGKEETG